VRRGEVIHVAILKGYHQEEHRADVQLTSSLTTYLENIPVAMNIGGEEMLPGRHVILAVPEGNTRDAVIIAIFNP